MSRRPGVGALCRWIARYKQPGIFDRRKKRISIGDMNTPLEHSFLLSLLAALSLVASCSRSSTPATPHANMEIVPGTGVGRIKFGMAMDDVKKALGQPDPAPGKPLQYTSLGLAVIPGHNDGTVAAIMMGDTGGGQLVERFKGVTTKGIGMKSTPPGDCYRVWSTRECRVYRRWARRSDRDAAV